MRKLCTCTYRAVAELGVIHDLMTQKLIDAEEGSTLVTLVELGHPAVGDAIRRCDEEPRALVKSLKTLMSLSASLATTLAAEAAEEKQRAVRLAQEQAAALKLHRAREAQFVGAFAELKPQWQYVGGPDGTWSQARSSYSFHAQMPPLPI